MDIGLGDLTFMTDGTDYCCIWSPHGEDHTSPRARPLALISVALLTDKKDFDKWAADIRQRWEVCCAEILNANPADITTEVVSIGNSN